MRWRLAVGYKRYLISNFGDVWDTKSLRYLKGTRHPNGYIYYEMVNNVGKRKKVFSHRLVAIAFIPNEENKPQVNHINGVTRYNSVNNLEWVTAKENSDHAVKIGLMPKQEGEQHFKSKLTEKEVLDIIALKNSGKTQTLVSKMFNCHKSNVSLIWSGKAWKHLHR